MRKADKAAILLKNFPELPKRDVLECEKMMPHFMLFRYDLTSARCGACGKETSDDDLMRAIDHKIKVTCPECGREVMAVCDKYRYSVEKERFAQNWTIFQAGENGVCYAHCIRMHVNLHKELGYPAYEETLEIEVNGQKREAMAYLMNGMSIAPPSGTYYEAIRTGYLTNGMDTRYLEEAVDRSYAEVQNRSVSVFDDDEEYDEEEDEDFCFEQE